ncbi:MAG: pseudouridine synthase [Proteobacteria bacterium]|nr:pseudouridine synthase [Pseudomonadota bacterium]
MTPYSPPLQPLVILYEDEYLIAIDKPSGLLSVPGHGEERKDCAESRCRADYPSALTIHRLDMETSGILLLALSSKTQQEMSRLFRERQIEKRYEAWVAGEVSDEKGEIDLPLIKDWPNRPRQKVDMALGKPSLTHWQRVEIRNGASRLALFPKTGRSHQLRVHLQAIGHPILGDGLYAPPELASAVPRLQLHAERLAFTHPITKAEIAIDCPSPLTGPSRMIKMPQR